MKPLFWQEILEALENELTSVPREDVPVELSDQDTQPAEVPDPIPEDKIKETDNPLAEDADGSVQSRKLIDDPKKLVIFSEIMKPKFND